MFSPSRKKTERGEKKASALIHLGRVFCLFFTHGWVIQNHSSAVSSSKVCGSKQRVSLQVSTSFQMGRICEMMPLDLNANWTLLYDIRPLFTLLTCTDLTGLWSPRQGDEVERTGAKRPWVWPCWATHQLWEPA